MADLKKFLDQSGVSTLWSKIAEEVGKVDAKAIKNTEDIGKLDTRLGTAEGKIAALEAGTYDDSEVRGLIAGNAANIGTNADNIALNASAIAVLNGNAETTGSVANTATAIAAAEVAKIVADADASYDTLKEIADWILNDTTGAADMANDIAALELKVGNMAVVDQISTAINNALKVDGVEKYALASALTAAIDRIKALEDDRVTEEELAALETRAAADAASKASAAQAAAIAAASEDATVKANNAKSAAVSEAAADATAKADAAEAAAKGHAESVAGTAETNAKAHADTLFGKIQALSADDIIAAIASAT